MRVLVTGARGQLGNELRRCLEDMSAEAGPVPESYRGAEADYIDYGELDISDGHAVAAWFAERGPYDLVVNCAAVTDVDGCEGAEAQAFRVNALGPMHLARACAACGAKLVHVSTDYVFPGDEPGARREGDRAMPISAYGRTKWAGEVLALDACPRAFVVRTAWLYGYVGKNFAKTMMRLARERGRVSVVADQFGNPTSANDLAREVLRIAETEAYGVYHCTGGGECSWFDFARAVIEAAGIPCDLEAISSAEYKRRFPASADRPAHSALDNARLRETIGDGMRPWREALATYMERLPELGD